MNGREQERIAVLEEVGDMLEEMCSQWDHIDSAEQALRAARDEVRRRAEVTLQAWRDKSSVCSCGLALRAIGESSPHCHVHGARRRDNQAKPRGGKETT